MSPFGRAFADGDRLEVAGAVVRLKVHARARRVSLRLDRTRGEVVATAPTPRRLAEAAAFARDRAAWIAERIAELPQAAPLTPGLSFDFFGEPVQLRAGPGRPRYLKGLAGPSQIIAPGEGDAFAAAALRAIKRQAKARLEAMTATHCAALGVPTPVVAVMDARARWGSCRPGFGGRPGAIRYSWRLALAPPAVADYVVAHECAHLVELNHGPRFWAVVERLVGDHRPHRAWLKAEGARLHAFARG